MSPVLYNFDLDVDCYRIRLTAALLGVELEVKNIDTYPGTDHLTPGYLALNPLGRVPTLVDGDITLRETTAMQLAIAKPSGAYLAKDPATEAEMLDWMIFADRELVAANGARATALLGAPGDLPALTATARGLFRIMDDHLTRQALTGAPFFCGAEATLADIALFPAFALARDFQIDHDEFPALRLWARRIRALPGFITMPGIPDYH